MPTHKNIIEDYHLYELSEKEHQVVRYISINGTNTHRIDIDSWN